jgi:Cytochrome bd terminal oxidase subunit II
MLIGKTETERRVVINTIGPWWDANEVWLVVAGGSTFAAFPGWYRTRVNTAARKPPISSGAERVYGLSDQGGEMRGVEDAR